MNKQIITNELLQYGLSENEVRVYLCLLEEGPQTPLQLSRELDIDRSKIYRSMEKLIEKGFMEQSHAAWGKKLQASSPSNIMRIIQSEEEELAARKALLPSLIKELSTVSSHTKHEFEVRHYRAQEGLRQMLWNQLSAKKEIVAFSYKNKNDIVGKTYADKIRLNQFERKIMLHELENETDQGDLWYTDIKEWGAFYQCRHVERKVLDIKQYIAIFNHTVSIINWIDDEQVGLEIDNAAYADMQRQLFWEFWNIAGKNQKSA